MRIILTAFILFTSILAFCHEDLRYNIDIEAHASINGMKLNIKIERDNEEIKIFYNKLDSIDSKSSESDSKRIRLFKKYTKAKSKSKKERTLNKLKELNKKFEIYKNDSLVFNISENTQYLSLIDSIYKTDKKVLLRDMRSGHFITLDGTSFKIRVIEENDTIKNLHVHAPRSDSHPLLNKLICETLDLYRVRYPVSFLDKKHTNGY